MIPWHIVPAPCETYIKYDGAGKIDFSKGMIAIVTMLFIL